MSAKYLLVAYIKSPILLSDLEGIMQYYKFKTVESNDHYRVFEGFFFGAARDFVGRIKNELRSLQFEIEDSIFIIFPVLRNNQPSFSTAVVKRKGNKYLRDGF